MKNKFTPLHISLLIHIYTRPTEVPHRSAPAVKQFLAELGSLGLIEKNGASLNWEPSDRCYEISGLEITDKGRAFMDKICNTPLPVQAWI